MIRRYEHTPAPIEAVQLCWKEWPYICDLLEAGGQSVNGKPLPWEKAHDSCEEEGAHAIQLPLQTLHGIVVAYHGDWIARSVERGDYWPIHPNVFKESYTPMVLHG